MKLIINKDSVKKIFILEDNDERIKWFKKTFYFADLFITKFANVAIAELKTVKYDIIFLDHDLDGQVFVNSNHENTGYQVAKIIKDTINKDTPVVIHSLNLPAASLMKSVLGLNQGSRIPFIFLMKCLEIVESKNQGD
jgi:hypothetical protein